MTDLMNLAIAWLLTLMSIQSLVFVLTSNSADSMWKGYIAAWSATLHLLIRFSYRGRPAKTHSVIVWAVLVLSLPGAIIVLHFFF